MVRAGVNPTDWKFRAGMMSRATTRSTPGQDGAGVVDAVGDGRRPGWPSVERVWLVLAQHGRAYGTAAEYTVQPADQVVPLPRRRRLRPRRALGVPAVTAHRALTPARTGRPARPGAAQRQEVLVAGGAGAVGNAAIQLARWAGATVITTVSSEEKAALARPPGPTTSSTTARATRPPRSSRSHRTAWTSSSRSPRRRTTRSTSRSSRCTAPVSIYANNGGDELTMPLRAAFSEEPPLPVPHPLHARRRLASRPPSRT